MLLPFLLSAAVAGTAWTESKRAHGCVFYVAGTESSGATPVRAECTWAVPADRVLHLLHQRAEHHRYFAVLDKSLVLEAGPDGTERVYQLHRVAGMKDREVVVEFAETEVPGGQRITWAKAADQGALTGAGVEVVLNEGHWEVTGDGELSRVVYEVRYLPGGMVPSFVMRWFQGPGIREVLAGLRAAVEKAAP